MKTKETKEEKPNRFTYSDDEGLSIVSKGEDTKTKPKEKEINKAESNELKGGTADNQTVESLAKLHNVSVKEIKEQLYKGVKVEMEHTTNPKEAVEIAMDHIFESPEYYDKLEQMENTFK